MNRFTILKHLNLILVCTAISMVFYIAYLLNMKTYTISYNIGVVIESGACMEYVCAAKINMADETLFVQIDSPVMVGQTVTQKCTRGNCRSVWTVKEDN